MRVTLHIVALGPFLQFLRRRYEGYYPYCGLRSMFTLSKKKRWRSSVYSGLRSTIGIYLPGRYEGYSPYCGLRSMFTLSKKRWRSSVYSGLRSTIGIYLQGRYGGPLHILSCYIMIVYRITHCLLNTGMWYICAWALLCRTTFCN